MSMKFQSCKMRKFLDLLYGMGPTVGTMLSGSLKLARRVGLVPRALPPNCSMHGNPGAWEPTVALVVTMASRTLPHPVHRTLPAEHGRLLSATCTGAARQAI